MLWRTQDKQTAAYMFPKTVFSTSFITFLLKAFHKDE